MDNQLFVCNIRKICKEKGKSVSQMEVDLGWSPGLISRWSKACPSFEKVAAIVDYLGISFENLLENDNESNDMLMSNQLVQYLAEQTESGKIVWKPCEGNTDLEKLILPLSENGCLVEQAYYCTYQEGFFFLVMAEDEQLPFSPWLYMAVDKYTCPTIESKDKVGLGVILKSVDLELYNSWIDSRRHKMLKEFLSEKG